MKSESGGKALDQDTDVTQRSNDRRTVSRLIEKKGERLRRRAASARSLGVPS